MLTGLDAQMPDRRAVYLAKTPATLIALSTSNPASETKPRIISEPVQIIFLPLYTGTRRYRKFWLVKLP